MTEKPQDVETAACARPRAGAFRYRDVNGLLHQDPQALLASFEECFGVPPPPGAGYEPKPLDHHISAEDFLQHERAESRRMPVLTAVVIILMLGWFYVGSVAIRQLCDGGFMADWPVLRSLVLFAGGVVATGVVAIVLFMIITLGASTLVGGGRIGRAALNFRARKYIYFTNCLLGLEEYWRSLPTEHLPSAVKSYLSGRTHKCAKPRKEGDGWLKFATLDEKGLGLFCIPDPERELDVAMLESLAGSSLPDQLETIGIITRCPISDTTRAAAARLRIELLDPAILVAEHREHTMQRVADRL